MSDAIHRILLEDLDIRGAIVQIDTVWQNIQAQRDYPPAVSAMLGEMCAVSALIAGNLKQPGRLTFQLRGHGEVSILVVDCAATLNLRGYAKHGNLTDAAANAKTLLGDGQLLMTLDHAEARQPYQSYVPMEGNTISEIFQHYLVQSEQQPAILILVADSKRASGLFLQKLPGADLKDEDGWNRVALLAQTIKPEELQNLDAIELLRRVFAEEEVRVFEPKALQHDFPLDWDKIRDMLRSVGETEVLSILAEHGEVVVHDDLSNHSYRFSEEEARALFQDKPTLH
jgi:molecular chaperone Hsp33